MVNNAGVQVEKTVIETKGPYEFGDMVDADGDGLVDMAAIDGSGGVHLWRNVGAGEFIEVAVGHAEAALELEPGSARALEIELDDEAMARLRDEVYEGMIVGENARPNDLDVNNKTVAKAYRLLERDSVIQTKGYRGTFVHPDAKANSTIDVNELVVDELTKTVGALRNAGATDSEIRIAFGDVMNRRTN